MKIRNILITLVSAIALLISTSTISIAKVVGDKIILGAAISLTGKYSSNGVHTQNGYNLAVDRINDMGGIKVGGKTYKFEIIYYDDESNSGRAAQLAERLIQQDGVKYMLGPYSSGLTKAMAPVTEKYQVPMVEENLLMGGYTKENTDESYQEAERIFEKYERLRNRRNQPAKVLSGGERRLLEISRALVMKPSVLLVDEPSIGLEPRYIDMVFEILRDLQQTEKKTIILVEQNAKKGLEFADIGYVLVSGQTAIAGKGDDLLKNPDVGRLFLGG